MKTIKQLITKLTPLEFKKFDLSNLRAILKNQINSIWTRVKFNVFLSLNSLIILGFVIAVIPLFLAIIYAAYGLRESSELGRSINSQVFEQTKAIRFVMQKTGDIERKAKLFVLLSDPSLRKPDELESYENTRATFKQALSVMLKLNIDNKIELLVNELSEKEILIYEDIIGSVSDNNPELPVNELFRGLREASNNLSREFETHVDHEFNELRLQSESLEQDLFVKGGILLVISFIFIALLLAILSRSIRQLNTSIRRLGLGELDQPIDVEGPSDLSYLGNRLEWLRTHLLDLEVSKQQFMHNVALEIDVPLKEIWVGAARLAEELNQDANSARHEIVQSLCLNVEKLNTVSKELIRFSQISAKPEANHKETVNMKALLDLVIEGFKSDFDSKSISLKKLVRPVEISGVNQQLRAIIEQLFSNAVKYSPVGGEIRIMLRDAGKQMELEIEDEGPGIEPDERPHVFEPFFRGKNAQPDNNGEGLGLGLAIVKEYVDNHHGKVDVIDTRHDQSGARFRVQIPLTDDAN